MGYEVKIFVGERMEYDTMKERDAHYFQVAGMVDICKPGYGSHLGDLCSGEAPELSEYPAVWGYLNGEKVFEDCYGKKLRALPLEAVLAAAQKDSADSEYRRFRVAIGFLETFQTHFQSDRLAVVLYGY